MTDYASDAKVLNSTQTIAALGVLFASICFGIVPYFSRNLTDQGLAPHAVAFYRYIITAVILLPAFLSQLQTSSGQLHRVRIGPQKDRESAAAMAARLLKVNHKGQVVPHP